MFPAGLITAEVKGSGFLPELMAETSGTFLGRRWGEQTRARARTHTRINTRWSYSGLVDSY